MQRKRLINIIINNINKIICKKETPPEFMSLSHMTLEMNRLYFYERRGVV
jgi:hypothetical protein